MKLALLYRCFAPAMAAVLVLLVAVSPVGSFDYPLPQDQLRQHETASLTSRDIPVGPIDFVDASAFAICAQDGEPYRLRRIRYCIARPEREITAAADLASLRYRVVVQDTLRDDAATFARAVETILKAGWTQAGASFVQVVDEHDFTIFLAEPRAVDRLCRPLRTGGKLSCAIAGRAVINAKRWRNSATTWQNSSLAGYRNYLINHEVGHLLGLSHTRCTAKGEPAPIMLPQTRYLRGCLPNGAITELDFRMLSRFMPVIERRLELTSPGRLVQRPRVRSKRKYSYRHSRRRRRRFR